MYVWFGTMNVDIRKPNDFKSDGNRTRGRIAVPPAVSLPILVFIDMFAVALVVPLLFQYYKKAGVVSATQRELLSSVFSVSQIIGGIVLGALTDAKVLRRKTLLFLSFGGSALAYFLIAYGGFTALILSRIMVGLVKQTMTVTTSMLTKCTTKENRTKHMGRLESSSTAAWILGPSTGALLFKYVDHKAPVLLASSLFVLNIVLAGILLSGNIEENIYLDEESSISSKHIGNYSNFTSTNNGDENSSNEGKVKETERKDNSKSTNRGFWENAKSCYSSQSLASVVASLLIFSWMYRATSYSSMGSYYEDMYGVEPHSRGYIQSYQRVWAFIVQSSLIQPILERAGGERRAIFLAAILLAGSTFFEAQQNFIVFLCAICPSIALSTTMMRVSLRSLLTQSAPGDAIFSVFAAMDVLQNASAVTVPFYRAFLFRLLSRSNFQDDTDASNNHSNMDGDPDPVAWVLCAGFHWVIASICMLYLLRPGQSFSKSLTSGKKDL